MSEEKKKEVVGYTKGFGNDLEWSRNFGIDLSRTDNKEEVRCSESLDL